MKVKYPNCAKCSFEGEKVMVFLNITEAEALRWRKIDPHFTDPAKYSPGSREAPGPAARFPASNDGWVDAMRYAESKLPVMPKPPEPPPTPRPAGGFPGRWTKK